MAEIEASLLAKVQSTEGVYDRPVLAGFLRSRKKYLGVMFKAGTGQSLKELAREIKKRGGKKIRVYKEINSIYAEFPVYRIAELSSMTCTEKVYDAERTVDLCLYESVPLVMGVERGYIPYRIKGKHLDGRGIKVAVLDTGIDSKHPDFGWRIRRIKNFTPEYAFKNTSHGTHVAGIIGGSGKLSGYHLTGIAPKVSFYIAKVLIESKKPKHIKMYSIFDAIRWAIKKKVHVINMSLGANWCTDGTCPLCEMANYAVSQGITVVVAAGNRPQNPYISCPGNAKGVITVGASTKTSRSVVPGFSARSFSPNSGKPDLVAPGVRIQAPQPGKGYVFMKGTSMSAPHVAGLVALLYQGHKYLGKRKRPTPAEIKQWLKQGCQSLGEHPSAQGSGLVNFDKTIKILQQPAKRSWIVRRKKKKKAEKRSQSVAQASAVIAASTDSDAPQADRSFQTCPAALNLFCPHYNPETCNAKYESCLHFQTASQEKALREVKGVVVL